MRTEHPAPAALHRAPRAAGRLPGLVCLFGLLLGGCGGLLQEDADESLRLAAESRAAALADTGEHAAAARAWLGLGLAAPAQRQRYQILAAREWLRAGETAEARRLIGQTPLPIQPANLLLWAEVAGSVLLASGEPARALGEIDRAPAPADPDLIARLLLLRAEALFALQRPGDAVAALLEREAWLADREEILAGRQRILAGVERHAGSISLDLLQSARDPVLEGWLALGYLLRSGPPAAPELQAPLAGWRNRYPDHPAAALLFPERRIMPVVVAEAPDRIALLLPLSGRQQALGAAVRDGFLAAHFAARDRTDRPEIHLYDVAALGVDEAWRRAVDEGSRMIVGPLLKESVQEIARQMTGVPVLALNALGDDMLPPPGLFQFGLYPEDEATEVVRRALADGRRRAVALIPANEWGSRMLTTFQAALEESGGQLLDYRLYDTIAADFSFAIQELLLLDESQGRFRRLAAMLGTNPAFAPRRRQDVEFIFLAATASSGKLIAPQLRFYHAGDIPTYATSAIWEEGSGQNADLDGVLFPDGPWIIAPDPEVRALKDTLVRHWSTDALARSRLYALGHDAYALVPRLVGSAPLAQPFEGMTGTLYMGRDGKIHRRLRWAQVRRGQPVAAPPALLAPERGGDGIWFEPAAAR